MPQILTNPYAQDVEQQALLAQMNGEANSGRAADQAYGVGKQALKLGNFRAPTPAGMGIGIAGELVGRLLKPKAQQATVGAFGDYLAPLARRREGSGDGVAGGAAKWGGRGATIGSVIPGIGTAIGGAIGGLVGGIGNLFTKNAASAYTDFSKEGAASAIRDIYRREGGREASDADVARILAGQGLEAGDRWVGEKGLLSVLDSLRNNFATEREALLSQMGGQR